MAVACCGEVIPAALFSWTYGGSRANSPPLNNSQASRHIPLLLICITSLLTGCASVSVGNVNSKDHTPKGLPERIYVREFTAPHDTFHVGRKGDDLISYVARERRAFAKDLAKRISETVAPAEVLEEGKRTPVGNFWLLEGNYSRANSGSRTLRMAVGFGAGGTKMETVARFSDLSSRPPRDFLSLVTTGGSGMAPGAWAAFTPALVFYWPGAVLNAGGAALSGLPVDRDRTAREISAVLSEYCHRHGWLRGRFRRPKPLGKVPLQTPALQFPKVLSAN